MTKILLCSTIIAASLFTACSSKTENAPREMVLLEDSMYKSSPLTDTAAIASEAPEADNESQEATRPTRRRDAPQPQIIYVHVPAAQPATQAPVYTPEPATLPEAQPLPSAEPAPGAGTETGSGDANAAIPEVKEKKGISKSAQGAIIGGVGGAVAGAVITKKGKGAVVGAVLGAAGGYILGRKKDKADGRIE